MQVLYKKIQDYYEFEKNNSIFFSILKASFLVFCGALTSNLFNTFNITYLILDVVFFLFFLFLEIRHLARQKNFPITILEHLTAVDELKQVKKNIARKLDIEIYIDEAIRSLNTNTCPITDEAENDLCHQDLELGIETVLQNLIRKTKYFLDLNKTQYTVGVYLDNIYRKSGYDFDSISPSCKTFFRIVRDDLNIEYRMPDDNIMNLEHLKGDSLAIHSVLFSALTNERYLEKQIELEDGLFTILASPIPNVCIDCPADGLIYILLKGKEELPSDLDNTLLIFGRILTNWISKYNSCVSYDFKNQKAIHIEEKKKKNSA